MNSKICVGKKTKKNLAKIGSKGMTWSQIIDGLIDHANSCDLYWNGRE